MNVQSPMIRIAAVTVIFAAMSLAQNNVSPAPKIGGLDVVRLERKATTGGKKLEFLSVTLLPGRGMNMFQITANIPGKGVTELLQSPSLEEAAQQMTGTDNDKWGNASTSFGGAFLVPWISRISGPLDDDGQNLTAIWHDRKVKLPVNFQSKYSTHGLIREAKAEDLHTKTTSIGQIETGVIHGGNFNGRWFSETDVHFTIALTRDVVEATIVATNVGKESEPMGAGWHPYFAIPSGDRSHARIHIPGSLRSVVSADGLVTGELQPVQGTPFDFTSPDGALLPENLLANFSKLERKHGSSDAWLIDPKSNYGIRVRAMSPGIKTMTVYAPKDRAAVAIEPQLNFPDPFGKQWKNMDTGMVTLQPGQSVTWKVRLELISAQP
jgi:galactose mutarotase-like enzyme